jgi:hypothetical protein
MIDENPQAFLELLKQAGGDDVLEVPEVLVVQDKAE